MLKQIDDDLWVDEEGHEFHGNDAEVMELKPARKIKRKRKAPAPAKRK